jgi:membrane-bound lytic murein transglycosylase MltF
MLPGRDNNSRYQKIKDFLKNTLRPSNQIELAIQLYGTTVDNAYVTKRSFHFILSVANIA